MGIREAPTLSKTLHKEKLAFLSVLYLDKFLKPSAQNEDIGQTSFAICNQRGKEKPMYFTFKKRARILFSPLVTFVLCFECAQRQRWRGHLKTMKVKYLKIYSCPVQGFQPLTVKNVHSTSRINIWDVHSSAVSFSSYTLQMHIISAQGQNFNTEHLKLDI